MIHADNAVIMSAGTSSRFAPLSYEKPKGLIRVRGEVLIERQIRQLLEAGIPEIIVVTGYKSEMFSYLEKKFGVKTVYNPDFLTRNNNSSIYAVRRYLRNTYICSSDNYFAENVFAVPPEDAYYAGMYSEGHTDEWCMREGADGYVDGVKIGGEKTWYMLGHAFWTEEFSRRFLRILLEIYDRPDTAGMYWEDIFMQHLDELKLKIRKYSAGSIFEFDTLDELREFDESYRKHTGSGILESIAESLGCGEEKLVNLHAYKTADNAASGFTFEADGVPYRYDYETQSCRRL